MARATDRLRALLFSLEPPELDAGLAVALRSAAYEIFRETPTRCTVDGEREPAAIDGTKALAFRIAREALINVRKHADAATVQVRVVGRHAGSRCRSPTTAWGSASDRSGRPPDTTASPACATAPTSRGHLGHPRQARGRDRGGLLAPSRAALELRAFGSWGTTPPGNRAASVPIHED